MARPDAAEKKISLRQKINRRRAPEPSGQKEGA
jgi:hypothetical protein